MHDFLQFELQEPSVSHYHSTRILCLKFVLHDVRVSQVKLLLQTFFHSLFSEQDVSDMESDSAFPLFRVS